MGVSRVQDQSHLKIEGETPEVTSIAVMQYLVGFGLTRWHFVEQDLTFAYLMLTCPSGSPVDGPLASFMEIQTIEAKARLLSKVLSQVLYQDEVEPFRTWAKKAINRIVTLNDIRNKLAHGMARINEVGKPVFMPYFNVAHEFRIRAYKSVGSIPGILIPPVEWNENDIRQKVEQLEEGPRLSFELVQKIGALFADQKSLLEKAPRMTLDRGLPYDQNPPTSDLPQEQVPTQD